MEQEVVEGSVEAVTYYNSETGFCVMKITPTQYQLSPRGQAVTITGVMPEVQPGEAVKVFGNWENNPRYGLQFRAQILTRVLPATEEGIRRYLGSGLVRGVGKRIAERIVDHFGLATLEILNAPDVEDRLREVRDVGRHRAQSIAAAWREQREIADVMVALQTYRVSTALAVRIYRHYSERGVSPLQVIQTDPYQLSRDIHGIGFKTADSIARNLGLPLDSLERVQAGLLYALESAISDGHVYLPASMLLQKGAELLEMDNPPLLERGLRELVLMGDLKTRELPDEEAPGTLLQAVYSPVNFFSEQGIVRELDRLVDVAESRLADWIRTPAPRLSQLISQKTAQHGITLSPEQAEGVRTALQNKVSILTGGPGTGKTTTLRALIHMLDLAKVRYRLASPTGRAAKRLSEATERSASTIHRLLGFAPGGFTFNQENPLETDFVVIDEASMLDIHLFYALLRAIPDHAHLLLVGDVDQLPSVGAGDVLRDLISSASCPVIRLATIFRQASGSLIIQNAHRINQGHNPDLSNQGTDFFFFGAEEPETAAKLLVEVVQERIPRRFGYDPIDDVQVLAPMYRTLIGVNALNEALQAALNPPGRRAERRLAGELFRVGDKVMQTRNNYEKEVFNGDIGRVHSLDLVNQKLTIAFEGTHVAYDWGEADQLTLAYACSVHRAQGSEYAVVVVPVMTQHFMMLQRNLLYTAITRARQVVVLVGTRKAVAIAVKNDQVARRYSGLRALLRPGRPTGL
ncbi:MAG: ATP-dependent RecD-like DNA helicase [Anaerolineae bacterium]|nr:ATP-dependent RecD-like DNA helicase [Anaerolineae bacterium]